MLSVEKIVQNRQKIAYSTLINFPCVKDIVLDAKTYTYNCPFAKKENSYYGQRNDIIPNIFVGSSSHYEDETNISHFETQGGIFSDEMGLGKTISLISLILSNPRIKKPEQVNLLSADDQFDDDQIETEEDFYEAVKRHRKMKLYEGIIEYPETISEARARESKKLTKKVELKTRRTDVVGVSHCTPAKYKQRQKPFFQSPATLVICPVQLVNQWAEEIKKNTKLKIITIATAPQHKKVTYKSLLEQDVIIISSRYLLADSYKNQLDKYQNYTTRNNTLSPLDTHPIFHFIGWHRIILDEAHECIDKFDDVSYKSNFRWYVSGTPLPKSSSLMDALRFINCETVYDNFEHFERVYFRSSFLTHILYDRAVKRIVFWRNTKQSVDNQVKIPEVFEEIENVYLSPIERTIYDILCLTDRTNKIKRKFLTEPSKIIAKEKICSFDDPALPIKYLCHIKTTMNNFIILLLENNSQIIKERNQLNVLQELIHREGETEGRKFELSITKHKIKKLELDSKKIEFKIVREIRKSSRFSRLVVGENTDIICDSCNEYVCGPCKLETCNNFICSDCIFLVFNNLLLFKMLKILCVQNVNVKLILLKFLSLMIINFLHLLLMCYMDQRNQKNLGFFLYKLLMDLNLQVQLNIYYIL